MSSISFWSRGALAVEGKETRVWAGRDPADPDKIKSQPIPAGVAAEVSGRLIVRLHFSAPADACLRLPCQSRPFWRKIQRKFVEDTPMEIVPLGPGFAAEIARRDARGDRQ